jgi:predicted phosphodiesterase
LRVAIVSDIHGNLPALEAVMKDLEEHSPDQVWCGGDIAWGLPWANECIELVRDSGWTTIKGNTDVWITGDPQTLESPADREELKEAAAWHDISREQAEWLLNLPIGHSGPGSILLVHGTPNSPFIGPQPDAPAREFEVYEGHASIVVYGHVHRSFVRRLSDGTIVANAGSVGMPMDGPAACYLLVSRDGPEWLMQHRRVAFDREAVVQEARKRGGPFEERTVRFFGKG